MLTNYYYLVKMIVHKINLKFNFWNHELRVYN